MAWKNTSTSRGVGAAPTFTATTSSSPSIARSPANISRVGLRHRRGQLLGHRLARLLELDLADRRVERGLRGLALLVGLAGEHRLEPRLELLPDPRHGEEPRRLDQRQVGDDLARVVAARDRHRVDDRQVVVRGALGDVRRRQPRDDLRAVGELDHLLDALHRGQQVAVRELRRPSAARSCPRCRSASAGRRARPRARRLDVEVRVGALDLVPGDRALPALALEHDHGSSAGSSSRAAWNASRNASSISATFAPASSTT